LAEIIRFRMLMSDAGYQDGNDADTLPRHPMLKLAFGSTALRRGVVLAVDNIGAGKFA
jgi:hypothetical protein